MDATRRLPSATLIFRGSGYLDEFATVTLPIEDPFRSRSGMQRAVTAVSIILNGGVIKGGVLGVLAIWCDLAST